MEIWISRIAFISLILAALVLTLFAFLIIKSLFISNEFNGRLGGFLLEVGKEGEEGKPSISRLQMIIWNFVIGFAFIYIVATNANIDPETLEIDTSKLRIAIESLFSTEILILLGISNVTYLGGKILKQGSGNESVSPNFQDSSSGANTDAPDKSVTRVSPSRGTLIIESNDE